MLTPASTEYEIGSRPDPTVALKILSLALVYPNQQEPGHGLFIRARLQQMAKSAELKVVAPVPLIDYLHPRQKLRPRAAVPFRRDDESIEVFHPRWYYPPLGTAINVLCLFLRVLGLARQIRKSFPFQVIDAHFGYPEGAAAALLAQALDVPFVVTLRGNEIKFAQYRFRRLFLQWALHRAARVITVSHELRALAISLGVEPHKAKTISNGIDPDLFAPRGRTQWRERFQIPSQSAAIVCVGELVERKGHHLVVRALRGIVAQGIDAHVWIAGTAGRDGPAYEQTIRALAAELGLTDRVHFLGFVNRADLPGLLSTADAFCMPSNLEGWPNAVHEATACGVPVVATAVGGIPDMIPCDRYGYVVAVGDQQALESALLMTLRRSWDRDAIAAWGRSRSWNTVASEALDEIAQVVAEDLARKRS